RSEEVYAAALRLFREKGYHATSMQDIAAALGLYKGSLYHYIGSKDELLARVFERGMGALLVEIERIAADATSSPSAQVRQIVDAHVAAVAPNLDALTVYLHEWRALTGEALATVQAQRERYTRLVGEVLARGVQGGEFQIADVRIATLGLIGMCNWVCQWYQPQGRLSPTDIAGHFAAVLLDGLRGSRPARAATSFSRRGTARPPSRRRIGSGSRSTDR
ncbi:MAG: TetR/AcrR family transcriptional regulator, partial [Chloroflexota bacterium]|nr:TetR/AcrR family transcriptional regulator [Chloroflexota bacterium]